MLVAVSTPLSPLSGGWRPGEYIQIYGQLLSTLKPEAEKDERRILIADREFSTSLEKFSEMLPKLTELVKKYRATFFITTKPQFLTKEGKHHHLVPTTTWTVDYSPKGEGFSITGVSKRQSVSGIIGHKFFLAQGNPDRRYREGAERSKWEATNIGDVARWQKPDLLIHDNRTVRFFLCCDASLDYLMQKGKPGFGVGQFHTGRAREHITNTKGEEREVSSLFKKSIKSANMKGFPIIYSDEKLAAVFKINRRGKVEELGEQLAIEFKGKRINMRIPYSVAVV